MAEIKCVVYQFCHAVLLGNFRGRGKNLPKSGSGLLMRLGQIGREKIVDNGVGLLTQLANEISAEEMACVYGMKKEVFMF
jgi:hypothetical protein